MILITLKNNQTGTSAVEFALVLPVLLILIFGMIEFSIFLFNKQILTNAAREGTRTGVLIRVVEKDGSRNMINENNAIKKRVKEFTKDHLITFGEDLFEDNDITITRTPVLNGSELEVSLKYKYDFLYLSLPPINLAPITINASSNMRME